MIKYIPVGKIIGTYGVNGTCRVRLEETDFNKLGEIRFFFIAQNAVRFVPYHLEKIEILIGDFVFVYFEDINTKEQALRLVRESVYLDSATFSRVKNKSATVHFIGYSLYESNTFLGIVEEILLGSAQPLAKITRNNKEILIPLHKDFIVRIDNTKCRIFLRLPNDLLSL